MSFTYFGVNTECDAQPRKHSLPSPVIVHRGYSVKRRRISLASTDLSREMQSTSGAEVASETLADRFISSRPKSFVPLNVTPRTQRIARVFGLADDRVLKFSDAPTSTPSITMHTMLRTSASQLFRPPPQSNPTSAAENLGARKQFILALDGPGISQDPFAFPITWSLTNDIAVACDIDVYYQNLDTRRISHLCQVAEQQEGLIRCIEWGGKQRQDTLALGTTSGMVQLWDAVGFQRSRIGMKLRTWNDPSAGVGGISWQGDVLAVGRRSGMISLFDVRVRDAVKKLGGHKGKVCGLKWSPDGSFMASGDFYGGVFIWDARACKSLAVGIQRGARMKHQGAVKALAWCPWKPDLLASGSIFPEGKICIWSTHDFSFASDSPPRIPTALCTISLHTSVTSLQWSPHCKELLSTHGSSWVSPSSTARADRTPPTPVLAPSALTNSVTVHSYPGLNRLVSIPAHVGTVSQSCLSPDGTMVFTICPQEESIKMWKVWGKREVERKDSVFDKCAIR